ncbi:MAG TPA: M1 family metallopeptidase [Arenimonas sp.]|uniref:M1 family metallopeptidase n=1 Tax=Arenimonas sp. TaxID=1872635 RepID=UPI002D0B5A3A|nr:M1 family metallopeptidase [Arenimonas sp.]HMB56764.1 M1 family metallopeptidase [Arenimonas sp.]
MRRILVSAIVLALAGLPAVSALAATGKPAAAVSATTTQLPRTVRPSHYDVAIVPDAKSLTFAGKVGISIDVLQPTASITLNALDMSFSRVQLLAADGKTVVATGSAKVDADAQTATFSFAKEIAKGRYQLALDYTGKIGTQANGLFAIDYDTAAGSKRALYTQFENSDARRLIPSWDEPAYKATFALSADVPSDQMAVSNMPAAQTTDLGNGRALVRFAPTPKMSTYLLFFALGDFDRASDSIDGTEVGVVTQKGVSAQAAFALSSAKTVLLEYNDYFATRYPLPKLDNVASPGSSQFFGAMENWGAIYTFEYAMLLDPSISTEADKQEVFSIEAHEMAHQWFGDLVTMRWWDDLWLNEGFASWMASRTTEKLHPEWNTALQSVGSRESAMGRDAVATTHPVVQHVETVEQASQAFDAITYSKGEAVIHMLEGYVGANAWRDGVRRYMKAHAYGNTSSDDLWKEIEAAAGKPITAIAHDFTLQPGVPLIRVGEPVCSAGKTTLTLTQGEFTTDRPDKKPLSWRVPVIAGMIGSDKTARALVTGGKATISLPGCGAVIVNAGQSGYYRTLYSPKQFAQVKSGFGKLAPIDQLGVLSDSWSLSLAGLQPTSDFLDLAKATPIDADPQIWGKVAGVFSSINTYYNGDAARQAKFRTFAIAQLAPAFAEVGWTPRPGELDTVAILRSDLIYTLSALGDPAVIAEARRRYAAQASDPAAMPAALRKTILAVVARHADAALWDQLHAAAIAEKTPLIKDQWYGLLASPEDAALAQRALDLSLTAEPGATNSAGMISDVAGLHPDMAFDFAMAHMGQVNERVDATSRGSYYPGLAGRSADPAMIGKIKAYALANLAPGSRRGADTAAVSIAYRVKIRRERLPAIDAWLAKHRA